MSRRHCAPEIVRSMELRRRIRNERGAGLCPSLLARERLVGRR